MCETVEPAEPHGVAELKDVRVQCSAELGSRDMVEHPGQLEDSSMCGSCQAAFTGKLLSFLLLLSFKSLKSLPTQKE